jgi:hypothetical protein
VNRPGVVASLSAVALLALACAGVAAPPQDRAAKGGKPVAFTTIVQQAIPGQAGQQVRAVARDADTWRALWAALRKDGGETLPAEPPAVDFPREMVLAVAMPTQSCVSKVTIQSIGHLGNPSGGTLLVNLLEAPPAPNCRCIVASRPIHAVRLPRTAGTPRFVVTRGQTSCGP